MISQFFYKIYNFISFWEKPAIYLISDTHFDHENIIKYCKRPFKNVKHMNTSLMKNWNLKIKKTDTVYFIGDFVYGKKSHKIGYWIKRLNGKKCFIRGNHDEKLNRTLPYKRETIDGIHFLFMHNPEPNLNKSEEIEDFSVLEEFKRTNPNGWLIYGHKHNNNLNKYPFFDPHNRCINVSVECINYRPVALFYIIKLIKNENRKLKTINDKSH